MCLMHTNYPLETADATTLGNTISMTEPWSRDQFLARLREVGSLAYHDKHPFHLAMNQGRLTPSAIRGWVANRFYYQQNIPRKDAAILSNCPVREVRQVWIHRILDHDGVGVVSGRASDGGDTGSYKDSGSYSYEGGIEAWLRFGEACGLSRAELLENDNLLPAVRFAVDAYVNFARTQSWPMAIASSLTELFAPNLMAARVAAFEKFYTWIEPSGLDYFKRRLSQAGRDSDEALTITLDYCATREMQEAAVRALHFKCDVLWSILDTIHARYHV